MKVLKDINDKFEQVLPDWIALIKQSFLSKSMQKRYIEFIQTKHLNFFN